MISDTLISEYAQTRSNDAFAELVKQYVDLVYSSARRQINDPHLAEDVTQAVFILLSQKAGEIPANRPLAGWLLTTTRYVVANLRRELAIRKQHEEKASAMKNPSAVDPTNKEWNDIAPLLDDGLSKLSDADRDALLLRFTDNKTVKETGLALGISEAAAEKRIARAIEKLRSFFARHGVPVNGSVLSIGLASQLITQAPQSLTMTISQSSTVSTAPLVSKLVLTKTKVGIMTAMNIKIAAGIAVALATTGTGIAVLQQIQNQTTVVAVQSTQPVAPQPVQSSTADEIYSLKADEPIRIIKDAPLTAREEMWRRFKTQPDKNGQPSRPPVPAGPFVFNWNHGKPEYPAVYGQQGMQLPLNTLISTCIQYTTAMESYNVEISDSFPKTPWEIPGDIVYTNALPIDKTLASLQKVIRDETGLPISISLQNVPRKVFVVKGEFKYKKLDSTNKQNMPKVGGQPNLAVIEMYGSDNINDETPVGSMSISNPAFGDPFIGGFVIQQTSSWIGDREIIDESKGWPTAIGIRQHMPRINNPESQKIARDPDRVLKHFCEQTGLTYSEETRIVPRVIVQMEEKK